MSDIPGPRARYQSAVESGLLLPDEAQRQAVEALQVLAEQLIERSKAADGALARLMSRLGLVKPAHIKGLYLWGGVGRGKTCLMDIFFQSLPLKRKLRLHFHRFMQMVHAGLRDASGKPDPLVLVAAGIARQADVLCFDEFYVADIGDAMILANLLKALFVEGVVLVATSNIVPERLYEDGLQRRHFLPAIELLNRNTTVMNVDGGTDYRQQSWQRAVLYHSPVGVESAAKMVALFGELTRSQVVEVGKTLEIQGRLVESLHSTEDVVWFDFKRLCSSPRGAADYIELASQYHTVLVSGVPVFSGNNDDEARRFIALVDEFYDHKVKLVLEAAVPLNQLYQGLGLAFAFERTRSRLTEMQSAEYLAAPHRLD